MYEHADPRQGEQLDWGTYVFNFGRNEVRNFLIGSALCWLKKYHADGLRVDAVASMLYLNYSRKEGEWIPNRYGGNENLEAIAFLRRLNELAHELFPGIMMVAEESTSWPGVSRPVYLGGLGFTFKWNMGWMHDMLDYYSLDPVYRSYHHSQLTFSLLYAFTENFVLPLSHDEVVHGKKSLLNRMPGDYEQKFANLRAFFAGMMTHPGKKLLFMGGEFAQWIEWNCMQPLDWNLLEYPRHEEMQRLSAELNQFYRNEPCLWEDDFTGNGFQWIDGGDCQQSVISYIRWNKDHSDAMISPSKAMKNRLPRLVRSFFVTVPITAIAPNVPAVTAKVVTIASAEYAANIKDKVSPLTAAYRINRAVAVAAAILLIPAEMAMTSPNSTRIATQNISGFLMKSFSISSEVPTR